MAVKTGSAVDNSSVRVGAPAVSAQQVLGGPFTRLLEGLTQKQGTAEARLKTVDELVLDLANDPKAQQTVRPGITTLVEGAALLVKLFDGAGWFAKAQAAVLQPKFHESLTSTLTKALGEKPGRQLGEQLSSIARGFGEGGAQGLVDRATENASGIAMVVAEQGGLEKVVPKLQSPFAGMASAAIGLVGALKNKEKLGVTAALADLAGSLFVGIAKLKGVAATAAAFKSLSTSAFQSGQALAPSAPATQAATVAQPSEEALFGRGGAGSSKVAAALQGADPMHRDPTAAAPSGRPTVTSGTAVQKAFATEVAAALKGASPERKDLVARLINPASAQLEKLEEQRSGLMRELAAAPGTPRPSLVPRLEHASSRLAATQSLAKEVLAFVQNKGDQVDPATLRELQGLSVAVFSPEGGGPVPVAQLQAKMALVGASKEARAAASAQIDPAIAQLSSLGNRLNVLQGKLNGGATPPPSLSLPEQLQIASSQTNSAQALLHEVIKFAQNRLQDMLGSKLSAGDTGPIDAAVAKLRSEMALVGASPATRKVAATVVDPAIAQLSRLEGRLATAQSAVESAGDNPNPGLLGQIREDTSRLNSVQALAREVTKFVEIKGSLIGAKALGELNSLSAAVFTDEEPLPAAVLQLRAKMALAGASDAKLAVAGALVDPAVAQLGRLGSRLTRLAEEFDNTDDKPRPGLMAEIQDQMGRLDSTRALAQQVLEFVETKGDQVDGQTLTELHSLTAAVFSDEISPLAILQLQATMGLAGASEAKRAAAGVVVDPAIAHLSRLGNEVSTLRANLNNDADNPALLPRLQIATAQLDAAKELAQRALEFVQTKGDQVDAKTLDELKPLAGRLYAGAVPWSAAAAFALRSTMALVGEPPETQAAAAESIAGLHKHLERSDALLQSLQGDDAKSVAGIQFLAPQLVAATEHAARVLDILIAG